jgi:hypothetical protein
MGTIIPDNNFYTKELLFLLHFSSWIFEDQDLDMSLWFGGLTYTSNTSMISSYSVKEKFYRSTWLDPTKL